MAGGGGGHETLHNRLSIEKMLRLQLVSFRRVYFLKLFS